VAITKWLARDGEFEVAPAAGSGGPAFLPIGGVKSIAHSPSTTRADGTDFDSAGHPEHIVAERGEEYTLEGFHLEDVATGTRDSGQARMEVIGAAIGLGSLGSFRWTSPGGNIKSFSGSVEITEASGGNNDNASWTAKITVSGEAIWT
jgi:hypothetical protein